MKFSLKKFKQEEGSTDIMTPSGSDTGSLEAILFYYKHFGSITLNFVAKM